MGFVRKTGGMGAAGLVWLFAAAVPAVADGPITVAARADGGMPAAVRMEIRTDDVQLAEAVTEAVGKRLLAMNVLPADEAEMLLRIAFDRGDPDPGAARPTLRIEGQVSEGGDQSIGVEANLNAGPDEPAVPGRKISVVMTLFQEGRAPIWSGTAASRAVGPPPLSQWLTLSDALLDYFGKSSEP